MDLFKQEEGTSLPPGPSLSHSSGISTSPPLSLGAGAVPGTSAAQGNPQEDLFTAVYNLTLLVTELKAEQRSMKATCRPSASSSHKPKSTCSQVCETSPKALRNRNPNGSNSNGGRAPRQQGNSRRMPKTACTGHGPCLTPDERKKLLDANACFYCKKSGHHKKQCPKSGYEPPGHAPERR
jgi:hypothetical protein